MKNENQANKENTLSNKPKQVKFFYTIEDFPKFRILEENFQGILNELLSVINKEKQINLTGRNKIERTIIESDEIHHKKTSSNDILNEESNFYSNFTKDSEYNYTVDNYKIIKDNVGNYTPSSNNKPNITNKPENLNKTNVSDKNFNISNEVKSILIDEFDKDQDHDENKTFEPWVEKNLYQESNEEGWDVAPLMIGGEKISERWEKFPFLASLVSQISGVVSVSFSLLKPGTHIVPHKGYDDYSEKMFRYHMGLIIPEGDIGIRVEKEIRKWEKGKSFVFDDFMIHEAWNFTPKNRIVLIIDFLKDETKIPEGIKFFDANFNKSVKGYLKKGNNTDDENCDCEAGPDNIENQEDVGQDQDN